MQFSNKEILKSCTKLNAWMENVYRYLLNY